MERDNTTADRIEAILKAVVAPDSGLDPAPVSYFMLFNPRHGDRWILGFLFDSAAKLRVALESGVSYRIHQYVSDAVAKIEGLQEKASYVVFDCGELPTSDAGYQELHQKFAVRLDSLQREREEPGFELCRSCGHPVDQHEMRGWIAEGASAPTEGWMICPEESCMCFRTWSVGRNATDA